jgi:sialate O-acetylesterase
MNRKPLVFTLIVASCLLATLAAQAEVRLPHVFGSHMVLQRDMPIPVWGWDNAAQKVEVRLGDVAATATADAKGAWRVDLPAQKAGGPFTFTVTGSSTVTLTDVLVGEVWLCSGQSNMEMTVGSSMNLPDEVAHADHPEIRQFHVAPYTTAGFPQSDVVPQSQWTVCTPQTVPGFTAAGYFMARDLLAALKVPIGLINSSWGGTLIEPWTPPVGFAQVPALDGFTKQIQLTQPTSPAYKQALTEYLGRLDKWSADARANLAAEKPIDPAPAYPDGLKPLTANGQAAAIYNAMIYPLIPYAIRGAIWYQGESNHFDGMLYTEKMKALIGGWRQLWGEGNFPFYFVQIAPFGYGDEPPDVLPKFWQAQEAATAIPNTGMASTMDVADIGNIHPTNKQAVGHRLALLALAGTYGKTGVASTGPAYKSHKVEGDAIRVTFSNIGAGLKTTDGKAPTWFQIANVDTGFVDATAKIDGDSVVLSSPNVKGPQAMRFAWSKNALTNLVNSDGLPALSFTAGELPRPDMLPKIAAAAGYTLVYDLDIAKAGGTIPYDVDNSATITKPFDHIAYLLELQLAGKPVQYAFVSMKAFTADIHKIGVPAVSTGALFQVKVDDMTVASNVDGIVTGTGLKGNIEFWPHNYGPPNTAGIPNASDAVWDFGDQYSDPVEGYGSMQVHNYEAKQTIFAYNNWRAGASADLGFGNSDGKTLDWTFKANAATYSLKRLRVLVHLAG